MDRRQQILDVAGRLTQQRGFNGFSYIDLSEEIGIKTSSIHYYFKKKDDLATAMVEHQKQQLKEKLQHIDASHSSSKQKLRAFVEIFKAYIDGQDKYCLCGMLAAEVATLGPDIRMPLLRYFEDMRQWLTAQFSSLGSDQPEQRALAFVSAIEGALLIARLEKNPALIDEALGLFFN